MVDKEQIKKILKKYYKLDMNQVTIHDDGVVDVRGNVALEMNMKTKSLMIQFGEVGGNFYCHMNQLKSLAGAPTEVGGDFYCAFNQLTSLAGAPERIGGKIWLTYSANLPLLRCLVATRIEVNNAPQGLQDIMNDPRWVGNGKKGSLMCAAALIKAGFEGNAKW